MLLFTNIWSTLQVLRQMQMFLLDLLGYITVLSLSFQSNRTILCTAVNRIKNCITGLEALRAREKHGGFLDEFFGMDSLKGVIPKFQEIELKNTRDIEFDDLSIHGMPLSFRNAVSSSVDFVVDVMRERYESLLNDNCIDMCAGSAVNGLSMLFNLDVWPENDLDLVDYG